MRTFEPVEEERPGQICVFGNINAPGLEGSESVSWDQTHTDQCHKNRCWVLERWVSVRDACHQA